MPVITDLKLENIQRLAESLAKAGKEGVRWERRHLEWIRQEKKAKLRAGEIESSDPDNHRRIER